MAAVVSKLSCLDHIHLGGTADPKVTYVGANNMALTFQDNGWALRVGIHYAHDRERGAAIQRWFDAAEAWHREHQPNLGGRPDECYKINKQCYTTNARNETTPWNYEAVPQLAAAMRTDFSNLSRTHLWRNQFSLPLL